MKISVNKGDYRCIYILGDYDQEEDVNLIIYKSLEEDTDMDGYTVFEDDGEDFEEGVQIIHAKEFDDII